MEYFLTAILFLVIAGIIAVLIYLSWQVVLGLTIILTLLTLISPDK